MSFSLHDLENCVERSIISPVTAAPSLCGRSGDGGGYISFDDVENALERSIISSVTAAPSLCGRSGDGSGYITYDEVENDFLERFDFCPQVPTLFTSSTTPYCPVSALPMYYPLDHTHLRLLKTDPLLSSCDHPLDAVLRAQNLLSDKTDRFQCTQQVSATKSIAGTLDCNNESVDFRIKCFVDHESDEIIIEFHRRCGSAYVWNCYFVALAQLLKGAGNPTTYIQPFNASYAVPSDYA